GGAGPAHLAADGRPALDLRPRLAPSKDPGGPADRRPVVRKYAHRFDGPPPRSPGWSPGSSPERGRTRGNGAPTPLAGVEPRFVTRPGRALKSGPPPRSPGRSPGLLRDGSAAAFWLRTPAPPRR